MLKHPAVSQRPTLAVRGEVITMTASSQDSIPSSMASLFLLLLLPAAFTQNFAVPTIPTASLFDPLTQPECMKKEHPKVSIQALSPWISTFSHPGVRDYSQLTLDLTRNELIVGASCLMMTSPQVAVLLCDMMVCLFRTKDLFTRCEASIQADNST
ncbi:Semaphorin-5B Semaphorin-G [Collichthys lucidus]|uniref:Semaphorin-5B Semaphorin-G n=1 Tax=Collichthys lucidus TaxID=240159 RepID=A0A4V6AMA2_COLLU|nr:Semaphorin-5B Semaphorin-G [Collichthys lucidus]